MNSYVGVNGVARKIKKIYVGVNGIAREVKTGYVGVNGIARKWWSSFIPLPNKGDIVKMNLDGTEREYRVLSVNGSVCKVMGMWDDLTSKFNSSTTTTMGSLTVQKYEGGTLDTYLNTTWYNTLSTEAKNAIVPENIVCDAWYWDSSTTSGDPVYSGSYGTKIPGTYYYAIGKYAGGTLNIGNRNVFALGVQDVIDYLNDSSVQVDTTTILRNVNIWKMFWNDEVSNSNKRTLWLRSSYANSSDSALTVGGSYGYLYYSYPINKQYVRPALNLDMSKISYTIV